MIVYVIYIIIMIIFSDSTILLLRYSPILLLLFFLLEVCQRMRTIITCMRHRPIIASLGSCSFCLLCWYPFQSMAQCK